MAYDHPIGQSFAPLGSPNQNRPGGPEGTGGVGQAISTLNLRYPRVQGAAAIAPSALLNSPGSAGLSQGINPTLAAILQAVLGRITPQQSAPSAPGGMTPGSIPPPRVVPIVPGSEGLTTRPPYTPPAQPLGPRTPPDRPERTREGFIPGGGFTEGRGVR